MEATIWGIGLEVPETEPKRGPTNYSHQVKAAYAIPCLLGGGYTLNPER